MTNRIWWKWQCAFASSVLKRLADLFLSLGTLALETLNCRVKSPVTLEKLYGKDLRLHRDEKGVVEPSLPAIPAKTPGT